MKLAILNNIVDPTVISDVNSPLRPIRNIYDHVDSQMLHTLRTDTCNVGGCRCNEYLL